jgi:hypothetical protein
LNRSPNPLCAMTLTVLLAICLFACAFYLYVLFQWMRDKKRKPTGRLAIGDEAGNACQTRPEKRPHLVDSRKPERRIDWPSPKSSRVPGETRR